MQSTCKQCINKWDDGWAQGWAIGIRYSALLTLHRTKKMEWKLNGDIQTHRHLFHFKPCYVQLTGLSAPRCQCKHGFHDKSTHTSATVSSAGITAWGRWTTAHCCGHFTGRPKNNGRSADFVYNHLDSIGLPPCCNYSVTCIATLAKQTCARTRCSSKLFTLVRADIEQCAHFGTVRSQ